MEYALIVNTEDCVGCHACEVACKQIHNLPVGTRLIKIDTGSISEIDGKEQFRYAAAQCLHCSEPSCLYTCRAGAIVKRQDGIVIIKPESCTGCGSCFSTCPLGAMDFNGVKEIAQKCDLCVERLEKGQSPACVAACPSHCIYFGNVTEVSKKLKDKRLLEKYKAV